MSTVAVRDRPLGWWGMLLLVATEATLFGVLLASYYYLRFEAGPAWPPEGIPEPKVVKNLWINAILVASSVPMLLAVRRILAGNLANTEENVIAWIRSPQQFEPRTAMPDGLSEDEARDVAAYLYCCT